MKRDIAKRIEEGRSLINEHISKDMTTSELDYIYRTCDQGKDLFNIIRLSFLFGVSVGNRIRSERGTKQ